jgi:hypothetical protein
MVGLPTGFVCFSAAMSRRVQSQVAATGSTRRPAFPVFLGASRARVLAVLDARTRGLPVSPEAAATAFVHDRVLGRFPPSRVLEALRKTGQPEDHQERKVIVAALRAASRATSEAGLWLAALDDELTGGREYPGFWMSEEDEKQVRFEKWPDGVVYVTVRKASASAVAARVERLISAFLAIPPEQEPWNLMLNHGAGFARSALKVEHMRREGIMSHTANSDWRIAIQSLVEQGAGGFLTPLLVAQRDGPPENVNRELKRLRGFCKRNGLPMLVGKARLQGK